MEGKSPGFKNREQKREERKELHGGNHGGYLGMAISVNCPNNRSEENIRLERLVRKCLLCNVLITTDVATAGSMWREEQT